MHNKQVGSERFKLDMWNFWIEKTTDTLTQKHPVFSNTGVRGVGEESNSFTTNSREGGFQKYANISLS